MDSVSDDHHVKVMDHATASSGGHAVSLPIPEALGLVPHHSCIPEIERWVFRGVPYLASVHCISDAEPEERDYCQAHDHQDADEINLLLGTSDDFRFRITLDGREHVAGPVAALFIPAGTMHSANVLSGSGYYVVFKMSADGGEQPTTS